jgi:ABC-type multidrug transport system permease subunit
MKVPSPGVTMDEYTKASHDIAKWATAMVLAALFFISGALLCYFIENTPWLGTFIRYVMPVIGFCALAIIIRVLIERFKWNDKTG